MMPGFDQLLALLRWAGTPVVFEIDDYVFETGILEHIDAVRYFPKPDLELYVDGLKRYRAMLMQCEYFTGSTQYLADRASELGRKSYVLRNGLNDRQLELAITALQNKHSTSNWVQIGYLSGTSTHQADFGVAVSAIVEIIDDVFKRPASHPRVSGIPITLSRLADRINSQPFVGWEELVAATAELDVSLAPLEQNPFTEAKSALKYFEAGLVEVPTVASPNDDFRVAIRHGENGLLASTEQEWYECLRRLVTDAELRQHVGRSARQDVLHCYTPNVQGASALRVFSGILFDKVSTVSVRMLGHYSPHARIRRSPNDFPDSTCACVLWPSCLCTRH